MLGCAAATASEPSGSALSDREGATGSGPMSAATHDLVRRATMNFDLPPRVLDQPEAGRRLLVEGFLR